MNAPHAPLVRSVCAGIVIAATAFALATVTVTGGTGPWNTPVVTASDATGEKTAYANGGHPDFTGPDRITLTMIWNGLTSRLGREVFEDGVVTDAEMNRVERAYNACLSVYGIQSRDLDNGESFSQVHGSLDDDGMERAIQRCQSDTDYGTLSMFHHDTHASAGIINSDR
ncbi:hypothetical protein JS528_01575 [Bifidobacterium sp. MA2]|uniref:Uncharacterized protein n=1 Tax=Bifidobacterium santillanense TaxID=2809028 RepID=A0ABS5UMD2_9BIFI|nr:hypothetical protein [Bifidobacterium santillanense]MBT1172071.1 hypothetical protein [Bifidobacterium santillanense]